MDRLKQLKQVPPPPPGGWIAYVQACWPGIGARDASQVAGVMQEMEEHEFGVKNIPEKERRKLLAKQDRLTAPYKFSDQGCMEHNNDFGGAKYFDPSL